MARHPYTCPFLWNRAGLSLSSLLSSKSVPASLCIAVVIFLGLATHAPAAELAERQWSASFPDHTAIPEKFGAPIRERFSESDTMQPPGVQMPVFPPGRKVGPIPAEPIE